MTNNSIQRQQTNTNCLKSPRLIDETLGEFPESLPLSEEYLLLGFSPSLCPLKKRWRNNGLSADFFADYLTGFFVGDKADLQGAKHSEIQSAISYIANELLENAIKFNDSSCSHPISIQLRMYADKLTFLVTNSIKPDAAEKYKAFIQEVLTRDPGEMLLRRLVKNAEEDHLESPGIGILCMMNDYLVTIGWKFTKIHGNSAIVVSVTTMVQMII